MSDKQITSSQLQDLAAASKTCFDGGNHLFWQNLAGKLNEYFAAVQPPASPVAPVPITGQDLLLAVSRCSGIIIPTGKIPQWEIQWDKVADILNRKLALAPVATGETQKVTVQTDPQGRTIAWQPQPTPKFILKCRMCGHVAGEGEWVGMVGCSKCTPTRDHTVNCAAQPAGTPLTGDDVEKAMDETLRGKRSYERVAEILNKKLAVFPAGTPEQVREKNETT